MYTYFADTHLGFNCNIKSIIKFKCLTYHQTAMPGIKYQQNIQKIMKLHDESFRALIVFLFCHLSLRHYLEPGTQFTFFTC